MANIILSVEERFLFMQVFAPITTPRNDGLLVVDNRELSESELITRRSWRSKVLIDTTYYEENAVEKNVDFTDEEVASMKSFISSDISINAENQALLGRIMSLQIV
jgi:hypothetical protein